MCTFEENIFLFKQLSAYQTLFAKTSLPGHYYHYTGRYYSSHFGEFIKPKKKNVTLSLKDSQFNRLPDCWIRLLYLIDDIGCYLKKFPDILNNVAITDRDFVNIEVFKPIFSAIALLELHITGPFHCLLMNKDTTYSNLLYSFTQFYKDLTKIDAK